MRPWTSIGAVCGALIQLVFLCASLAQDDARLEPFVVTADALVPWEGSVAYSGETWDREHQASRPGTLLSDQLRGQGGFRLFRRQSALTAHPTTQGASLRIGGPNGASRAKIYLDGVPMNDAFGGWIPWTALNAQEIGRTSTVQPSGIDPWGNVNLGGTVWLEGHRDTPFWSAEVAFGNAVEHQLSTAFRVLSPTGNSQLYGSWLRLHSPGYHVIHPNDRGAVDEKATLAADSAMLGWRHDFESDWALEVEGRFHEERRGNGTPVTRNAQQAWLGRLSLERERGAGHWEGGMTAYWQQRDFSSVFSSVSADRERERPVLDQFEVPATLAGLTWRSRHWSGESHEWLWSMEGRFTEGETNERFRNLGAGFTRQRRAGGERWEWGAVGAHTWRLRPNLAFTSSLRLDHTRNRQGQETTWDLETGTRLLDQAFPEQSDWDLGGRLGLEWEPSAALNLHASAFSGTRQPTLNELYRPFRVGNDITLANASLDSERLWGATAGARWQPEDAFSFSIEGFWHQLDDAIANVTLVDGGQNIAPWGFIPGGGSGRQRRNLDAVSITGLESRLAWESPDGWGLELGYLLTDSEIEESRDQPDLESKSLSQMPTHQAYGALWMDAGHPFHLRIEGRWTGRAFDDDLNQRSLNDYWVLNALLGWRFSEHVSAFISLENLLDETIEVSRSGSDVVGVGPPRLFRAGMRWDY